MIIGSKGSFTVLEVGGLGASGLKGSVKGACKGYHKRQL